jgi:tryptophan 2,3-dioxygenase
MDRNEIVKAIEEKYQLLGENPDTYLKGLLQAKLINYWDYIEVDTLLSLQKPRTDFKDEEVFIIYHQITELTLKLMLHEIKQMAAADSPEESFLIEKLKRVNRYTGMLISSFGIMKDGMNYDDYNTFRATLTPASGFQSAQFRYIELYCTRLQNLINEDGRKRLPQEPSIEQYFENIYWRDAGLNRNTGRKTLTLKQFEEKYLEGFIALAKKLEGKTIEDRVNAIVTPSQELKDQLRAFDRLYNIEWPIVHLNTAKQYLDSKKENQAATGGSEWKKYLNPHSQQRKFFPEFWTNEEINIWGN